MAYNETLAIRVREALTHLPGVEEKKMFGGLAFMVDGKMCITVGRDRIMCRINPLLHNEALKKEGASTVVMGGKNYKGYIHIKEEAIIAREDFQYWLDLALEFNKTTKASGKK